MPYACSVPGCRGNYKNGPKVHMFRFPTDQALRNKWTSAIQRENFVPSNSSRVCELHFPKENIIKISTATDSRSGETLSVNLKIPRLQRDAVPTQFTYCPEFPESTEDLKTSENENSAKVLECPDVNMSLKSENMATTNDSSLLFEMLSQRGKTLLVFKNFKFREYNRKMASGETKWMCHKDKCRAFIQTIGESGNRIITSLNENHTHEPQADSVLQRQIVSSMIREKATSDIGETASNIIKKELTEGATFMNLTEKDVNCIRKNIYYARRKVATTQSVVELVSEDQDGMQILQPEVEIRRGEDSLPLDDNIPIEVSSNRKFLVNQHLGTELHKRKMKKLEELNLSQNALSQPPKTTSEQNEQQQTAEISSSKYESQEVLPNIKMEEDEVDKTLDNKQAEIDFFVKGVAAKLMKLQNENFRMVVQRDIDMLLYDAIIGTGRYSDCDINKGKERSNSTQNFGGALGFNTESNEYLESIIKTEDTELS